MSQFTAAQRAEIRDATARSILAAQEESRRLRQAPPADFVPKRPKAKQPVPPKTALVRRPTKRERALADRLLQHICPESVIDRKRHALCLARTILDAQRLHRRALNTGG